MLGAGDVRRISFFRRPDAAEAMLIQLRILDLPFE